MGHILIYRIGTNPEKKDNFYGERKEVVDYNSPIELDYASEMPLLAKPLKPLIQSLSKYMKTEKKQSKRYEPVKIRIDKESLFKFPEKRIKEAEKFIQTLKTEKDFILNYYLIPIRSRIDLNCNEPYIIFNDDNSQTIITFDEFLSCLANFKYRSDKDKKTKNISIYVYDIYDAHI